MSKDFLNFRKIFHTFLKVIFRLVIFRSSHRCIKEYFSLQKIPEKQLWWCSFFQKNFFKFLLKTDLACTFRGDLEIYKAFAKIVFEVIVLFFISNPNLHFSHELFRKNFSLKVAKYFLEKEKVRFYFCFYDAVLQSRLLSVPESSGLHKSLIVVWHSVLWRNETVKDNSICKTWRLDSHVLFDCSC